MVPPAGDARSELETYNRNLHARRAALHASKAADQETAKANALAPLQRLVDTAKAREAEIDAKIKHREASNRSARGGVAAPQGADAVVSGTVSAISVQPVGFTDQQLASRYLFTLTMDVEFTDSRTSEVLWSNSALTFREEYELSTRSDQALEGATFLSQERSSFDRIADDVASTVVTAIVEAF